MTGDSLRHRYVADVLYKNGSLAALVVEKREPFIPDPPGSLEPRLKELFVRHFKSRAESEQRFFGETAKMEHKVPTLFVAKEELNGPKVGQFLKAQRADLAMTYGVHVLSGPTLALLPRHRWNIHGGLSPWYRGCITLFWPSYLLEPQMTGMTVHELTERIDGGPIVHQCAAPLVRNDGLHDLGCRAVKQIADELPGLLALAESRRLKPSVVQKTAGKLWTEADWRPAHLRLIYDVFGDRIVDAYLDGKFGTRDPELVRQ